MRDFFLFEEEKLRACSEMEISVMNVGTIGPNLKRNRI